MNPERGLLSVDDIHLSPSKHQGDVSGSELGMPASSLPFHIMSSDKSWEAGCENHWEVFDARMTGKFLMQE